MGFLYSTDNCGSLIEGFTNYVLPDGTMCIPKNYMQYNQKRNESYENIIGIKMKVFLSIMEDWDLIRIPFNILLKLYTLPLYQFIVNLKLKISL